MAFKIMEAPLTEGEAPLYTAGVTSADKEGSLHVVGTRLYHIRDGANFDYLDEGAGSWTTAAYSTLGLSGSQTFLYAFDVLDGVILVTTDGGALKLTAGGITDLGKACIDRNIVHGTGCEYNGYYYFVGVKLEKSGTTITPKAIYQVVDKTDLSLYHSGELASGTLVCYPVAKPHADGVGVLFNTFDTVAKTYTPTAWTVALQATASIAIPAYPAKYPHKMLAISGNLCWAVDDTIYRWTQSLGLQAAEVLTADYFYEVIGAGDYTATTQGFYTISEVFYSDNAVDWTSGVTQIAPTNVYNMEQVTFLKPEGLHVTNMEQVTFLESAGLVATNLEVVTFLKSDGSPAPLFNMYTGNETAGSQNITDGSSFARTVTVTGATNIQADGSVFFDGDDDYLSVPHDAAIGVSHTDDISYEVEFTYDSSGDTTQSLFNKRDASSAEEFRMTINGGNIEFITFITGSADVNLVGATSLVNGQRYNFKAVRSSGTWTIYLDNVSEGSQAEGGTPSSNAGALYLGHSAFNASRQFKGYIHKAVIWDGALTV